MKNAIFLSDRLRTIDQIHSNYKSVLTNHELKLYGNSVTL